MPVMDQKMQVEISIRISQPQYGSNALNLHHVIELPATDFLGLAGIMKRFHDLAQEITGAADAQGKNK